MATFSTTNFREIRCLINAHRSLTCKILYDSFMHDLYSCRNNQKFCQATSKCHFKLEKPCMMVAKFLQNKLLFGKASQHRRARLNVAKLCKRNQPRFKFAIFDTSIFQFFSISNDKLFKLLIKLRPSKCAPNLEKI